MKLRAVIADLNVMLAQIPNEWNPHQRLEFFKMAIRTTMAEAVGRDRGELRRSISEIEDNLDDMHELKCKACTLLDNQDRETKVGLITDAIDRLNNDLSLLREKKVPQPLLSPGQGGLTKVKSQIMNNQANIASC